MLEGVLGRLLSGAIWGVGAGLALVVFRGSSDGLRPVARTAIRTYLSASNRVREITAETMENFEDLYAEAKSERELDPEADGEPVVAKPAARRTKARAPRAGS